MEVINISDSDDDDRVVYPRSGFTTKSRGKENSNVHPNTITGARTVMVKKEQITQRRRRGANDKDAPAASQSSRKRVPRKRKEKPQVLEKKETPISKGDQIPQAIIRSIVQRGMFNFRQADYDIHSSLRGKKVIIYGLQGYYHDVCISMTDPKYQEICNVWRSFYVNRIMGPAYEIVEKYEGLKEKGIDQILLIPANYCVSLAIMYKQHPKLLEKHGFLQFLNDIRIGKPGTVSYYDCLGLEIDVKEPEWDIPLRTRRFILVVDDLKVKLANIESSNGEFNIPCADEIVEALDG